METIYKTVAHIPISSDLMDDAGDYELFNARILNRLHRPLPKHRITLAIAAVAVVYRMLRR